MHEKNIIGTQVRKHRYQQGLTQEMLAARTATKGWDISRGTLSKIEAQVRCVSDRELLLLSKSLKVSLKELYPPRLGAR